MNVDNLKTLYNYNYWANGQILQIAERLDKEQLHKKVLDSHESIFSTLVHTLSGEYIWRIRWNGTSLKEMLDPTDFPSVEAVRLYWYTEEHRVWTFLNKLQENDLERVISYTRPYTGQNAEHALPLWKTMMHVLNHSTQHRSEIAMLLTELGHSPGYLDQAIYFEESEKK